MTTLKYEIEVRPEVARFAQKLEETLKRNDHKGGWQEMTFREAFGRLCDEWNELLEVVSESDGILGDDGDLNDQDGMRQAFKIVQFERESFDVVAFLMFIIENFRRG